MNTETWLKWLLRGAGVSVAGILAFAFWLGTISAKVSSSEQTINRVYGAVLEDPNSLTVRVNLIEYRLTGIENRLTSVAGRLTAVENRLTNVENKLTSMDTKLNDILLRLGSRNRR